MPALSHYGFLRRNQIKGPLKTRANSSIKKARISILEGNLDNSNISVQNAIIALDKAAKKGAIHKKNAAGKKIKNYSAIKQTSKTAFLIIIILIICPPYSIDTSNSVC
ncbi:MAG: hypothetical protein CM1200mP37_0070 [Chloroflexota bacterium]|nr:MAG: hypothetical protein CM1200mP37_0070 [Chloroflexota bacterium]